MIVTPAQLTLDLQASTLVRSPGLHASTIYGGLYKFLDPKRYDYGDGPPNTELMALGSAWEDRLEKILLLNGVNAQRPDEMMSPEGIAFSPDLIVQNGVTRVGEIKLTSMDISEIPNTVTNNLPPKFGKYECQMKLYAYWLELRHGWLAILSIRKPYAPVFRVFEIEWADRELQDNYDLCMNYAKDKGMLDAKTGRAI